MEVRIDLAEDRVDLTVEADRDVNPVALARDVPEQVRLATVLAGDEGLRALRARAVSVAVLLDRGPGMRDAEGDRRGAQNGVGDGGRRTRGVNARGERRLARTDIVDTSRVRQRRA